MEPYSFKIETLLDSVNDRSYFMTKESVSMQLKHDDACASSQFGIHIIITSVESYDVLVNEAILYLMAFQTSYKVVGS